MCQVHSENRDPYNGLLQSLYNWVVFHPQYNLTNQGPFFSLLSWLPKGVAIFNKSKWQHKPHGIKDRPEGAKTWGANVMCFSPI